MSMPGLNPELTPQRQRNRALDHTIGSPELESPYLAGLGAADLTNPFDSLSPSGLGCLLQQEKAIWAGHTGSLSPKGPASWPPNLCDGSEALPCGTSSLGRPAPDTVIPGGTSGLCSHQEAEQQVGKQWHRSRITLNRSRQFIFQSCQPFGCYQSQMTHNTPAS